MDLAKRPLAPEPYGLLPPIPGFEVISKTFEEGKALPLGVTGVGDNRSPELTWSGFPKETRSFIVNCFDPDAPTPAGYWHWTVMDIPASISSLPEAAGESDNTLPGGFHVRNDGNTFAFGGPQPPKGDRAHRYYFAVHALDVPTLGLDQTASPTSVAFNALFHTLARGVVMGTFKQ